MSYAIITELGFQASEDVTLVDTTWIQLNRKNGRREDSEQVANTLAGLAKIIEEDGLTELAVAALEEVTEFVKEGEVK